MSDKKLKSPPLQKIEEQPAYQKTTIKDIATACGVSVAAVSLTLAGKADRVGLKPATCLRIEQVAAELGYRPNAYRMALKTSRHNCVSLLLSIDAAKSNVPMGMVYGIEDELIKHNMHLSVSIVQDSELVTPERLPKFLREWMTDGFLINYTHGFPPRFQEVILRHQIPCVWLNSIQGSDCIHPADEEDMKKLVEQFIQRGHRRILYVDLESAEHYSTTARKQGYIRAMEEANLLPSIVVDKHVKPVDSALERLSKRNRPTGVVGYSPSLVTPYLVAAARLGLSIPRDLSLATVSDWHPDQSGIRITYMRTSTREIGRKATSMLIKKIKNPNLKLDHVSLPGTFDPGETLAEAP